VLLLVPVAVAQDMTPIALSGWNLDVVIERTAVGPPFTSVASEVCPGDGNAFYETDLPSYAWGLPSSRSFVSLLGDRTIFQLQPYTNKNALVLSSATGLTNGTLTLNAPATYSTIAILAHSCNATTQTGALTLNFADGSSSDASYFAPDWMNGTASVAWFGNGHVNVTNGSDTTGPENPRFYQTTINIAALLGGTNKALQSISFAKTSAGATAIYAVSGLLDNGLRVPVGGPVSVTGFNRDVVVENTSAGPPYTSAQEFSPGEGTAFYQSGLAGKSYGLPAKGSFKSAYDGTVFQFQSYTSKNALVLSSETGLTNGTLTLVSPGVYNSLAVIANSAAATSTSAGALTLHLADGSSFTTNYDAADWFYNVNNVALQGVERIGLSNGATQGAPNDPRFYQTTVDLVALFGAANQPLVSVTFTKAAGVNATGIYAVSGVQGNQTNGTYTLATVTNSRASGIQPKSATIGGAVVAGGGALPEVLIYYGSSDGATASTAWAHHVFLGNQAGSFSQTVSALSPGTPYYFRAVAINPAGVAWAGSSQTFNTASISPATVTNLSATSILANVAVLSGEVLSTGGDAPTITFYYGTSNGGTTPSAWDHSVVLAGAPTDSFSQLVSGLATNTTYYYSAEAVNAAGVAWGTPVQSFTTLAAGPALSGLAAVLTGRNDNARTGQNTNETILTPANVNKTSFGRIFSYSLDGCMVAQPLVLPNVSIPGKGVHNLLFGVTEHDTVYAFDADSNAGPNAAPLWKVSFINPAAGVTPLRTTIDLQASSSPGFYGPEVGISATPAIDPLTGTIYIVAKTREVANNSTNYVYRIHALDVSTGAEKFGGPVVIQGTVPGVGDGFDSAGNVAFLPWKHMTRPALLLNNGVLCVSFTSHQDFPPYHGWVFTYNAYTLQPLGVFNTTPNGSAGGIWQGSSGPAADAAGNIYFETGNGTFAAENQNFGDAVVKLASGNGLSVADYFAPYNQLDLNLSDLDIGSAGLILLPDSAGSTAHRHLLVAGSKTGVFWLLDRDNLGQYNPLGDQQIVQEISGATAGMWVTPAYFNGAIYYCAVGDNVKAFAISNATINPTPISKSTATIPYPGSSLSVSANGNSNAIVWGIDSSANQSGPAILHAYNATNLAVELYNSSQNLARDNPGPAIKFTMPTIANGKVYVGTANSLAVFGNFSSILAPVIAPPGGIFTNTITITLSASNGAKIYYTLDGSMPTTNSLLYSGPFTLTNSAGVQAIAVVPGQQASAVASASYLSTSTLGNGTGLLGQYYRNSFPTNPFVGTPVVRTDPTINFDWNTTSPDPSIPLTNYTVRWTGMVQPLFSQTYTFSTTTDDGVRLWVNGQQLINQWAPQSPTTWSGSINLQALQLYPIEMDYFQAGGGAVAQLSWSSPSTAPSIIPESQLYPFSSALPVLFTSSVGITNNAFSLQLSGMPGRNYVIQAATNLFDWVSISTNVPPTTLMNLIEPLATNSPTMFFRAIQLP